MFRVVFLIIFLSGCGGSDSEAKSEYGAWELIQRDGLAMTDSSIMGDAREGYLARLVSVESNKILTLRCQTYSTTRNGRWDKAPSMTIESFVSDYNVNSKKMWNTKATILEHNKIMDYLANEEMFFYDQRHSFETKGWNKAWKKAMKHCLDGFNTYVGEWNEEKGTVFETVELKDML